jgi:hypothetical protein
MLKFCITGVALAMLILMFISIEGHWLASTRATVIIKSTGQIEHTFTSVFEVMHEIHKDVMRPKENLLWGNGTTGSSRRACYSNVPPLCNLPDSWE